MSDPDVPEAAVPLGAALAREARATGTAAVQTQGGSAEAAVTEAGPVGVVLEHLRVDPAEAAPLPLRSRHLAEALRPGGERLVEVECDPSLGGATLRSAPADMRDRRFFEVVLDADGATLRRHRVGAGGERVPVPFALTREELARTVDRMRATPPDAAPAPSALEDYLKRQ